MTSRFRVGDLTRFLNATTCRPCDDRQSCGASDGRRAHFHGFGSSALQEEFTKLVDLWLTERSLEHAVYAELQSFDRLYRDQSCFDRRKDSQAFTTAACELIGALQGAADGTTANSTVGESEIAPSSASSDSSQVPAARGSLSGGSEEREHTQAIQQEVSVTGTGKKKRPRKCQQRESSVATAGRGDHTFEDTDVEALYARAGPSAGSPLGFEPSASTADSATPLSGVDAGAVPNQGATHESGGGGGGTGSTSASGIPLSPMRSKEKKSGAATTGDRGVGSVGRSNGASPEDSPFIPPNPLQQRAAGSSGAGAAESIASSRPRRIGQPPKRFLDQMMNPGERSAKQRANKVSKAARTLPANPVDASIPDAPTFYPTVEDFGDPFLYIESIAPAGEEYGVLKIVPPLGWNPPQESLGEQRRFRTKRQRIHKLAKPDTLYERGSKYTIAEYEKMGNKMAKAWRAKASYAPTKKPQSPSSGESKGPKVEVRPGTSVSEEKMRKLKEENARRVLLEKEYWDVVEGNGVEVEVDYGHDLDIEKHKTGFPMPNRDVVEGPDCTIPCQFGNREYYRSTGWNLSNLPYSKGSVLRFYDPPLKGITSPWVYRGAQFSTFAWHVEDNYLNSINYHHSGAPKQWYGVPGKHAKNVDRCFANYLGKTTETVSEELHSITKMVSPVHLQRDGVPVYRVQQHAGQFVVTFPKAYHAGFSFGSNCGEAVNFAMSDWIPHGKESIEEYRKAKREAAISHDKLVATLTVNLSDFDEEGRELVVGELRRIINKDLEHRLSLEQKGIKDATQQDLFPVFRLDTISKESEDFDETRMCKVCKRTLFMSGVTCNCSEGDVFCLQCVDEGDDEACKCSADEKSLVSWWTKAQMSHFLDTAQNFLEKLRHGQLDEAGVESFKAKLDMF